MNENKQNLLKTLPQIDKLVKETSLRYQEISVLEIKQACQQALSSIRQEILSDQLTSVTVSDIFEKINTCLTTEPDYHLTSVINATGTILHTNLGRSLLSKKVRNHLNDVAYHYCNLEYDVNEGKRGSRYQHLTEIVKDLTGAEDVLVVNNNAAAIMLALRAIANDKEIIVSRGELVEIGGSFRIPEVIKLSGGTLVEVGTTNKTHLTDYKQAITENTGALLKVHTSNYRLIGFTEQPSLEEMASLAKQKQLPLVNDLGSGLFFDLQKFGLPYEPIIQEALSKGCDIVTFSGDKLLGGPQAGIIVGKREWIEKMRQDQLLRALRVDKLTLAALEATFMLYQNKEQAFANIPTLKMISKDLTICHEEASQLKKAIDDKTIGFRAQIVPSKSNIGGGSFPEEEMNSVAISLSSDNYSLIELEEKLRKGSIPIISRIYQNQLLLDCRTIDPSEHQLILNELITLQGANE
ncbi:L-seryl-tRNA(Sec) selenium transferase [Vagococcus zengguangii]|uniref:L-seryl-tRNA(Sec) selenium transferase n=1 Tax=Vagococcus zengguangii TaxID=2571750 RepID=UPI0011095262|nr:L-seryl-tRNA(Sec) selenium transferase [Vagococcus zengguangii]TLG81305.1 L-seryl-tRNA(Sec) selenium transferase [Vagococcus zengguangii]